MQRPSFRPTQPDILLPTGSILIDIFIGSFLRLEVKGACLTLMFFDPTFHSLFPYCMSMCVMKISQEYSHVHPVWGSRRSAYQDIHSSPYRLTSKPLLSWKKDPHEFVLL